MGSGSSDAVAALYSWVKRGHCGALSAGQMGFLTGSGSFIFTASERSNNVSCINQTL